MKNDAVQFIFLFSSVSPLPSLMMMLYCLYAHMSQIFSSFFMIMRAINVGYKYMNASMDSHPLSFVSQSYQNVLFLSCSVPSKLLYGFFDSGSFLSFGLQLPFLTFS